MLRCQAFLFFVALFVEVTPDEEVVAVPTASQPLIQFPRLFTSSFSAVQKRDLEGKDANGAGAAVEGDKGVQENGSFDHVGQKYVRKALDVLDQRLLKAAEAKRKGMEDDEADGEEEDDDDEDDIMEGEGFNIDNEGEHEGEHHDFEKIDMDNEKRQGKRQRRFNGGKKDAEQANGALSDDPYNEEIQGPVKRKSKNEKALNARRAAHAEKLEEDVDDRSLIKAQKKRSAHTHPMIPVDLNVNEGIEDEVVRNPQIDSIEEAAATVYEEIEESSAFAAPPFGIVGSAAAGVGVMGSAAYCCVSRRRSRRRHARTELPMYEPDSPPHSTGTPDGYRVRRGLTKYR